MRVAIHNPVELVRMKKNHTLYGYVIEYIRKYKPFIYIAPWKKPLRYFWWTTIYMQKEEVLAKLKEFGIIYDPKRIITSIDELNEKADVLINFTGESFVYTPEKRFTGMKVYHTQDFISYAKKNYEALERTGVDYVFCTGQLDKYSSFFRKYYPHYIGKVISFPFGYASRFKNRTPFEKRKGKVIATGSINPISITKYPVHDVLITVGGRVKHQRVTSLITKLKFFFYYHVLIRDATREYERFYKGEQWVHPFRRNIVENEEILSDLVVSKLPHFPQVKKYDFDLVKEFNKYKMNLVDDGLIEIVGGKAYEGIACGCVLVAPNLPYYDEFGFIDGKTCIRYKDRDLKDFKRKVRWYFNHPAKLKKLQDAGYRLVIKNYSHSAVARIIQKKLQIKYREWATSVRQSNNRY